MSKYADILKKGIEQSQSYCSETESVTTINERYIKRKRNSNYDRWEYAYFSHLINMYKIVYGNDTEYDPSEMYHFFSFIYDVSSKQISQYLDKLTEEEQEAYFKYQIKRDEL